MNIFSILEKYPGIEAIIFDARFIGGGYKIEQIKRIRNRFNLGLREAKNIIDSIYDAAPSISEVPDIIRNISPSFYEIYLQAFKANIMGLNEICGAGYRKALEYLIKDYIIKKVGTNKIEAMPLGSCIDKYLDDEFIKKLAARAYWLGNDETHYYRRWKDKDLNDLKKLIQLTINQISIKMDAEHYLKSMP